MGLISLRIWFYPLLLVLAYKQGNQTLQAGAASQY